MHTRAAGNASALRGAGVSDSVSDAAASATFMSRRYGRFTTNRRRRYGRMINVGRLSPAESSPAGRDVALCRGTVTWGGDRRLRFGACVVPSTQERSEPFDDLGCAAQHAFGGPAGVGAVVRVRLCLTGERALFPFDADRCGHGAPSSFLGCCGRPVRLPSGFVAHRPGAETSPSAHGQSPCGECPTRCNSGSHLSLRPPCWQAEPYWITTGRDDGE